MTLGVLVLLFGVLCALSIPALVHIWNIERRRGDLTDLRGAPSLSGSAYAFWIAGLLAWWRSESADSSEVFRVLMVSAIVLGGLLFLSWYTTSLAGRPEFLVPPNLRGESGTPTGAYQRPAQRFRMLTPLQTATGLVAIVAYCAVVILLPLPLFFLYPVGGVVIALLLFVRAPRSMKSRRR
jgi:hypothetical protein